MRALVLVSTLALASCQTPCPAPNTEPVLRNFHCEDGSDLRVTFTPSPDVARLVQEGYTTIDLPARITGAGYRYAANGVELRGRSSEVYLTRPGASETVCRATQ